MNKYFFIVLIIFNYFLGSQKDWSTTPIDNFINYNFRKLTFREPFYLIPYEVKIGLFSYGGPNYFSNIFSGKFDLKANPIILDNQDINDSFISSANDRTGYFFEIDIMKYNFLEKLYHQNFIDFHIGTGFRYSSTLSNPKGPIYLDSSNSLENYRFRPTIYDTFINLSLISHFSSKFFLYGYYSFGLSYASIYESLSQVKYLYGSGINENLSLGYKYIVDRPSLPYNYNVGIEFRLGRTYINKIYDRKDETPIIGLDLHSAGLFFTFGTVFGGRKTKGDEAFILMLDGEYIKATNKFKQFLNVYNYEFRFNKAKKMLNFCYTQIPYQYFDIGLTFFNKQKYYKALQNFNKAEQTADQSLLLEIESYKRDIAQYLINEVKLNMDNQTFSKSIEKLNEARQISPFLWSETDKVEAQILLKKANILKNLNNYSLAIDYFQQALELDPSLFIEINDIYTKLIIGILEEVNETQNYNDLILVKDYLDIIIQLKPKYSDKLTKFVDIIDENLKNYGNTLTKLNLKEYVKNKRKKAIDTLVNDIELGMSFYEIELILGAPHSISQKDGYVLWIYEISNQFIKTYFFKNNILVKIN
tara:strand:- start:2112 stop:3875 length:1764 start_codon:yes stop_codon:yes gene_type:complete